MTQKTTTPRGLARMAVKDWLDAAGIRYLDQVFTAAPLRLDFNKYGSAPYNCQAVIFLDSESEVRIALGGAYSGKKRVDYMISVEIYFRSTDLNTDDTQNAFDETIDAIKSRLRLGGHTLGQTNETIVWQAAEGGYGVQCDFMDPEPQPNVGGEPIEHYARMRFEVTQWITA
jgi:hypothetical protein